MDMNGKLIFLEEQKGMDAQIAVVKRLSNMYGLIMIKDYLDEILGGKTTYDARGYPTNKRGTIALVDSRSMKAYGTVDLVGIREINSTRICILALYW